MVLWHMCFQQKARQEMSFSKSNLKLQKPEDYWSLLLQKPELQKTCVTITIMKQANQTITENYWRRLNREKEAVTFQKLSKTPKGDYFFNPKEVLYESQHQLTNYNEKHFQKVDFLRAQNLAIFDIMGWIKFYLERKPFNHLAKPIVYVRQFCLATPVT